MGNKGGATEEVVWGGEGQAFTDVRGVGGIPWRQEREHVSETLACFRLYG